MAFILNTLQHTATPARRQALGYAQGVHMHLSPHSMSLTLKRGKHVQLLQPRFVTHRGRGGFVGWHLADPSSWPLAQHKLAFKKQT